MSSGGRRPSLPTSRGTGPCPPSAVPTHAVPVRLGGLTHRLVELREPTARIRHIYVQGALVFVQHRVAREQELLRLVEPLEPGERSAFGRRSAGRPPVIRGQRLEQDSL